MREAAARRPAVAGTFYAREAGALAREVDACFSDPRGPGATPPRAGRAGPRRIRAAMVPHAGLPYSGPIAAHVYAALAAQEPPGCVVILGVDHHGAGGRASLSIRSWETPLGRVAVDQKMVERLDHPPLGIDEAAHRLEHSIEMQLPFLQRIYPAPRIVPVQVGSDGFRGLEEVAAALREATDGTDALLLASTDFTHYEPAGVAEERDRKAIAPILAGDARGLYETVAREEISMCGVAPATVLLAAVRGRGLSARLLRWGHSGEAAPMNEVVGYAAIVLEEPPVPPSIK